MRVPFALAGAALLVVVMAPPGAAHPLPFSTLDLRIAGKAIEVSVTAHVFDLAQDLSNTPAERLLDPAEAAGDMFAGKGMPFIDTRNGGSGVGLHKTLANAVSGIRKVETAITGHSPLMTWNDFKEFAAFHKDLFEWAKAQKQAGKTVDEAAAAYQVPEKYSGYTVRRENSGNVKGALQAIYDDLKK